MALYICNQASIALILIFWADFTFYKQHSIDGFGVPKWQANRSNFDVWSTLNLCAPNQNDQFRPIIAWDADRVSR